MHAVPLMCVMGELRYDAASVLSSHRRKVRMRETEAQTVLSKHGKGFYHGENLSSRPHYQRSISEEHSIALLTLPEIGHQLKYFFTASKHNDHRNSMHLLFQEFFLVFMLHRYVFLHF